MKKKCIKLKLVFHPPTHHELLYSYVYIKLYASSGHGMKRQKEKNKELNRAEKLKKERKKLKVFQL